MKMAGMDRWTKKALYSKVLTLARHELTSRCLALQGCSTPTSTVVCVHGACTPEQNRLAMSPE